MCDGTSCGWREFIHMAQCSEQPGQGLHGKNSTGLCELALPEGRMCRGEYWDVQKEYCDV